MTVDFTPELDELVPPLRLADRIAELEARLAALTIEVRMSQQDKVKVSAEDLLAGTAFVFLCIVGLFVAWGLS
jgi:hypothetical protein